MWQIHISPVHVAAKKISHGDYGGKHIHFAKYRLSWQIFKIPGTHVDILMGMIDLVYRLYDAIKHYLRCMGPGSIARNINGISVNMKLWIEVRRHTNTRNGCQNVSCFRLTQINVVMIETNLLQLCYHDGPTFIRAFLYLCPRPE